ncbi:hypothetical protein HZA56_02790 [Candidatus Poribacteria bacterium]|nr:hypothetical protein [Candidatus Poribacteria bacterium]
MLKFDRRQPQSFRHTNLIDAAAIAAALLWLGLMISFGSGPDIPPSTTFKRGIAGAVFVYVVVFAGLQFAAWFANKMIEENRGRGAEGDAAQAGESPQISEPPQEKASDSIKGEQ